MKRYRSIISVFSLLLVALAITSCSKDEEQATPALIPDSAFSFEVVADNPQLVSFINTSENAEGYSWDFGDESENSTQKHPTHKYETGGTYTVTLKAIMGEKTDSTSQEITVYGKPTAEFSFEAAADDTYTIHFENQSEHVSEYTWDFGDGSETSAEKEPSHTYASAGTYTVKLSVSGEGGSTETSMEIKVKDPAPAYANLYIVGDASASGWNIESPEAFTQSEDDPFIFTYEGMLTPGNVKFSTFTGNWCDAEWINAPEAAVSIAEADGYIITQGCDGPDNQWTVSEETQGVYRITINLDEETIAFEKLTAPFSEIYAIGDASPNGWMPQDPKEAFVQSDSNPFVFTYEAYLSAGELKFATYQGDWCDGDWINASEADKDIVTASEFTVTHGCDGPDNKWRITSETEGNYLITINLYEGSISFQAQ